MSVFYAPEVCKLNVVFSNSWLICSHCQNFYENGEIVSAPIGLLISVQEVGIIEVDLVGIIKNPHFKSWKIN